MKRATFSDVAGQKSTGGASSIIPRLTCARCHESVIPLVFPSGPHLRADCPYCQRYLCFVPRCAPWLALLDTPSTAPVPLFEGVR
jgi:hypothetical protein